MGCIGALPRTQAQKRSMPGRRRQGENVTHAGRGDLLPHMDFLRAEALRRGTVPPAARRMAVFNQVFLERVLARGRLREVELGALYNLQTRSPLQNLSALPSLLRRGKLRLGGRTVRGPGAARRRAWRSA